MVAGIGKLGIKSIVILFINKKDTEGGEIKCYTHRKNFAIF